MFLSYISDINTLMVQYSNILTDKEINKFNFYSFDDKDDSLNIVSFNSFLDLSIKSGNYLVYGSSSNVEEINSINILQTEIDDLSYIFQILNDNLQDYNQFTISIYELIINDKGIDELFILLSKRYDSKICFLDNNKKLIYNIFNFNKVNDIFPLKITTLTFSRLYGYLAFESLDKRYDSEVYKVISCIKDYLYEKLQMYLISKDNFYSTIRNLSLNFFTEEDSNNLKNINWSLKDNYILYILQLKGGLFKYRDIFIHGNKFILDHPLYLYSLLKDNNLILLINESKLNNQSLYLELKKYINNYDLKYSFVNLQNSLLNYNNGMNLLNFILDNNIEIRENISNNLSNIVLRFNDIEDYIDLIIPNELRILQKYDKDNNMELLKTLHYYLIEERSLIKAAKLLNIHRNSVVYRINKINELVNIDLDNYSIRYNLIIGLEILNRINRND